MNSRVLRSLWRLSSIHLRGKLLPMSTRGYAISIEQPASININSIRRNYAAKAAVNESTPNSEHPYSKLQADFNAHGNVHPTNYQKLLESLGSDTTLTTEQSVFLLEACSDLMPSLTAKDRMQLFQKLWDHLEASGALTKQHYVAFLKVYASNGAELQDFRKLLDQSGLSKDVEFYEKLVQYACELGNINLATEVLAEMRAKGFALSENVFNALILGHSRNNNLKEALSVVDTMNAAGVRLSPSTYAQVVLAYVEHNDLEKATEIMQQYHKQFNPNQIATLIRSLVTVAQVEDYKRFLELLILQLPADFLNVKEVPSLIRNLCTELIHTGRIDKAREIIAALPRPKFNENQDTDTFGVSFLQDLFRSKAGHQQILEVAEYLIESGKNTRALHIACDSAMRRSPEQALPYLKSLSKMEPLRPHYFWPLLLFRFRHNGEPGILKTLKMMSALGVSCDYDTLSFYVLPRLSVTLENPKNAIKMLEDCGLKTSQMLTPIIANLIFQQKFDEVVQIAMLYTSKLETKHFVQPLANLAVSIRATKRYQKFSSAIHTLHLKSDDPRTDFVGQVLMEIIGNARLRNDSVVLRRLTSDLSKLGTRISPAAAEALNGHLSKAKGDKADTDNVRTMLSLMSDRNLNLPTPDSAGSYISHPRDMSYEELECHLVELEAKGLNTRGVLRRLLQICVRDNRLERALEIKKKCDEANVPLSPGMMASIFDLHIKLADFASASACYKQLLATFPGFFLDEHKLIDFAALTVQQNKVEDAKKLLSDRAASRKVFGGDYVIKNVWNLLTSIARLAATQEDLPKDKNLTKEFFFFIRKLGYCKSHNAVLGPIIREYIYRKDLRAAVAEFKTLAQSFRHTPLQFELMSILVRQSNAPDAEYNLTQEEAKDLLEQLTTTVASIHGQVNMNSSLLLAVAESGTENQLRKLLINPEFRINNEMMRQNCDHLNEEGSIYALMRLAKASRGLGHVIKEHDVYDMLLMKFVSDNNYNAALELFEKLEADDELKMSQEFLKSLVNLLKVNKIEIPSSLALKAQII